MCSSLSPSSHSSTSSSFVSMATLLPGVNCKLISLPLPPHPPPHSPLTHPPPPHAPSSSTPSSPSTSTFTSCQFLTPLKLAAVHSSLNMALFPVSFFFSFLYYTDVGSTLLVLLGYALGLGGHTLLSAVVSFVNKGNPYTRQRVAKATHTMCNVIHS